MSLVKLTLPALSLPVHLEAGPFGGGISRLHLHSLRTVRGELAALPPLSLSCSHVSAAHSRSGLGRWRGSLLYPRG